MKGGPEMETEKKNSVKNRKEKRRKENADG
jgi:hypothetical protein